MIKRADITGFTLKVFGVFVEFVFRKPVGLRVIAINFGNLKGKTYRILNLI